MRVLLRWAPTSSVSSFSISAAGWIFYWKSRGLAIELKVKGGIGPTFHQVERYTTYDAVRGVVLFRPRALALPLTLNDKPVRVIEFWQHML